MDDLKITKEDIRKYVIASVYEGTPEEYIPLLLQTGYYKGLSYGHIKHLALIMMKIGYSMKDLDIEMEDLEGFKEYYLSGMLDKTIKLTQQGGYDVTIYYGRARQFRREYDDYCSFCERVYIPLKTEDKEHEELRMLTEYKTIKRVYETKVRKLGEDIDYKFVDAIKKDMRDFDEFNRDIIDLDE